MMGLERLRTVFRPKEPSDSQRAEALLYRITKVFWLLAQNPRASKAAAWEEILPNDLEILNEKEREYLGKPDFGTIPRVYAGIEWHEGFIAIGLEAKRVKFSVNGSRPQLIRETRIDIGVWEGGGGSEVSWELMERIVSFVEQIPQRRLLDGSGPPRVDGLPGSKV